MFRIVRTRDMQTGKSKIQFDSGNGRSAYLSKDRCVVEEAIKKNRISKALRCRLPNEVRQKLQDEIHNWEHLLNDDKGLLYCEVYGIAGSETPTEQVQDAMPMPTTYHDAF